MTGRPLRLTADGYGLSVAGSGPESAWDPPPGPGSTRGSTSPRLLLGGLERSLAGHRSRRLERAARCPRRHRLRSRRAPDAAVCARGRRRRRYSAPPTASARRRGRARRGRLAARPGAHRHRLGRDVTGPRTAVARRAGRRPRAPSCAAGSAPPRRRRRPRGCPRRVVGLLAGCSARRCRASAWTAALGPGPARAASLRAAGAAGGSSLGFGVEVPSLVLALGAPTRSLRQPGARRTHRWQSRRPGPARATSSPRGSRPTPTSTTCSRDALAGRGPLADGLRRPGRALGRHRRRRRAARRTRAGRADRPPAERAAAHTRLDSPRDDRGARRGLGGPRRRPGPAGARSASSPTASRTSCRRPGAPGPRPRGRPDAGRRARRGVPGPRARRRRARRWSGWRARPGRPPPARATGSPARSPGCAGAFEGLTGGGTSIVVVAAGAAGRRRSRRPTASPG